jgi:hypothetical protein
MLQQANADMQTGLASTANADASHVDLSITSRSEAMCLKGSKGVRQLPTHASWRYFESAPLGPAKTFPDRRFS